MVKEEVGSIVAAHAATQEGSQPDLQGMLADVGRIFPLPPDVNTSTLAGLDLRALEDRLSKLAEDRYDILEKAIDDPAVPALKEGMPNMRYVEQRILLGTIDRLWVEHLTLMDERRREAGWATLQQVKAVDAYKNLGGEQWEILTENIRHEVAHTVYHVSVRQEPPRQPGRPAPQRQQIKQPPQSLMAQAVPARTGAPAPGQGGQHKVGRNDPCPCGSGKKYKHCHGR
jgi:preprotein translocase subunit SecA